MDLAMDSDADVGASHGGSERVGFGDGFGDAGDGAASAASALSETEAAWRSLAREIAKGGPLSKVVAYGKSIEVEIACEVCAGGVGCVWVCMGMGVWRC